MRRTVRVLFFSLCLIAAPAGSLSKDRRPAPPPAGPDIGQLMQTMQETIVGAYNPGRTEAARTINNAIHASAFQNVWPANKKVEGYIVHDANSFIKGIYPAPPQMIHGGDLHVQKHVFTGTGRWYTPSPAVIGPPQPGASDAMGNWDKHIRQKMNENWGWGRETMTTVTRLVNPAFEVEKRHPTAKPGGVRIHFDDRVLARALGKLDDGLTLTRLQQLGDALLVANNSDQVESALNSFINETKLKFVKETKSLAPLHGVVLVSLQQVLRNAQASLKHSMSLPQEVRTLGGLTRIHGYLFDPEGNDVILIGQANPGMPPIGLDNLIVALKFVWMKGMTPTVSLDPDPTNPGGAQRSRIHGIPRDTRFARIMLDADYVMKKMLFDDPAERVKIPTYRSLGQLVRKGPAGTSRGRFWLYPIQPGEGDIHLSSVEDVVLFQTGVRVLTEEMELIGKGLLGTGRPSAVAEQAAQSFTDHYGQIEKMRPIFYQLHGLFDLVMLSKIWQRLGVRHAVLKELASLSYRSESVPDTYPGVTVRFADRNTITELSGGVAIRTLLAARHQLHYDPPGIQRLRVLAKQLRSQQRLSYWASNVTIEVAIPQGTDLALDQGAESLARKDYAKALDSVSRALTRDPYLIEAYVMRALAHEGLGNLRAALSDIERALSLQPNDPQLRADRYVLLMNLGTPLDKIEADEETKSEVANLFYKRALVLWQIDRDLDQALAACDVILRLKSDYLDAYVLRAWLRLQKRDFTGALQDAELAVNLNPRSAQAYAARGIARTSLKDYEGAYDDFTAAINLQPEVPEHYYNRANVLNLFGNRRESQLDISQGSLLEIERYTKLLEREPDNVALWMRRGEVRRKAGKIRNAIEDFSEAIKKKPDFILAYAERASAYHVSERYEEALADASTAIRLDPEFARAYAVRGAAYDRLKRYDEAIRDCTKALELDPSLAYAYHIRADVKFNLRDYDGAISDWQDAKRLDPESTGLYQQLINLAEKEKAKR